jgi:hypothetical protein
MKNKKKLAVILGLLVLAGAVAWAYWPPGQDPQIAKVAALQEKLFSGQPGPPTPERREAFEEFRREAEKLTPEQRMQMMRDNPPPFMRQMQKNVRDYFDLSDADKKKALDKQIDEMERFRKQMESRRDGERRGRGGPGGGFRGFGGDPSRAQQFRKDMLNNTNPMDRAMFGEYMSQLQRRRDQRGLPPMRGPRF